MYDNRFGHTPNRRPINITIWVARDAHPNRISYRTEIVNAFKRNSMHFYAWDASHPDVETNNTHLMFHFKSH